MIDHLTEPLLGRPVDHEHPDEFTVGNQSLEEDPIQTSETSTTLRQEALDELEDTEGSTSRVRGTVRLLKLAQPQVLYLYIGCITLLIRLPFSLCIPHFGYANLRIVRGVRIDTFAAILRQEICFFDKHTSGELSSRLSSDCGEMSGGRFS